MSARARNDQPIRSSRCFPIEVGTATEIRGGHSRLAGNALASTAITAAWFWYKGSEAEAPAKKGMQSK
jgi:hypothetical protein